MKNLVTLVLIYSLTSCIRHDGSTSNEFILYNSIGEDVMILPTNFMWDTLLIKGHDKYVDNRAPLGKGKSQGIDYAGFPDFENPVVVVFNHTDTIMHYNDSLTHSGAYYNLTSKRCFYNKESYVKEVKSISKHSNEVVLRYTFTEQDYLDAQK